MFSQYFQLNVRITLSLTRLTKRVKHSNLEETFFSVMQRWYNVLLSQQRNVIKLKFLVSDKIIYFLLKFSEQF